MKKTITLFFFLLAVMVSSAQMNVLFVNDNGVYPPNTETVLSTLNQTGHSITVFDAVAENRSPELLEMQPYDLVVWYCGGDGVGRWFWNGTDSDNLQLKLYLEQGGRLWVMGTDLMYDRFGTPWIFQAGDFAFDFLGVAEYHAQSYGDDGSLGVPQLDLAPGIDWLTLNPISWIYTTLWWVDAMVAAEGSGQVYMMGPQDYVLSNYTSAIYKDNGSFQTLSFFFDPSLMDNEAHRLQLFNEVTTHFNNLVGDPEIIESTDQLIVFPNPASSFVEISRSKNEKNSILLLNTNGSIIRELSPADEASSVVKLNLDGIAGGLYLIKSGTRSAKLLIK